MHTHTFPEKIADKALEKLSKASGTVYFTNGTEHGLKESMQQAGIDYSVILPVATSAEQVGKINEGVIAMKESRMAEGLISFGAMHPDFENPKQEILKLKEAGVQGIKLHPAYVGTDFDDIRFLRILDAAGENNLAVTVHAGIDIGIPDKDYCSTKMILNVLSEVEGVKLILAHMGGWQCWDAVKSDLSGAPVYYDTSFSYGPLTARADRNSSKTPVRMTESQFVELCRNLSCEKIMFGTDCPWGNQKTEVERFLNVPLTDFEKELILSKNARKILGV